MFSEVDLLGAFAPILVVQFVGTVVIFVVADALLTKAGFFISSGTRRLPAFLYSPFFSAWSR